MIVKQRQFPIIMMLNILELMQTGIEEDIIPIKYVGVGSSRGASFVGTSY